MDMEESEMNPVEVELLKDSFIEYTKSYEGTFYIWGGDDPSGFDCSGLVVEVCKSVGILARGADYTGESLRQLFSAYVVPMPYKGCLAFFMRDGKAYHVEVCINKYQTIGASGGGSRTKTVQDAIRDNAFIKRRPIPQTTNIVFVDPFQVFA
jgi:cell wall-associated NlpC family hydrolase